MNKIFEGISNVFGTIKDFMFKNDTNVYLMIAIVLGGLVIFYLTYAALNKRK